MFPDPYGYFFNLSTKYNETNATKIAHIKIKKKYINYTFEEIPISLFGSGLGGNSTLLTWIAHFRTFLGYVVDLKLIFVMMDILMILLSLHSTFEAFLEQLLNIQQYNCSAEDLLAFENLTMGKTLGPDERKYQDEIR